MAQRRELEGDTGQGAGLRGALGWGAPCPWRPNNVLAQGVSGEGCRLRWDLVTHRTGPDKAHGTVSDAGA